MILANEQTSVQLIGGAPPAARWGGWERLKMGASDWIGKSLDCPATLLPGHLLHLLSLSFFCDSAERWSGYLALARKGLAGIKPFPEPEE